MTKAFLLAGHGGNSPIHYQVNPIRIITENWASEPFQIIRVEQ